MTGGRRSRSMRVAARTTGCRWWRPRSARPTAFVSTPSYSYYGPYELELVDLGPTQRRICPGTGTSSGGCTPSYTAGHGIKAANVCHNKRCEVDPRLQHLFTSTVTPTETVEVSVGNDPASKNLVQAARFTVGTSSQVGAAKFRLGRIEAFIHDTAGASMPHAAIYSSVTVFGMGNVRTPNQKLFDLESPPTFGRAPRPVHRPRHRPRSQRCHQLLGRVQRIRHRHQRQLQALGHHLRATRTKTATPHGASPGPAQPKTTTSAPQPGPAWSPAPPTHPQPCKSPSTQPHSPPTDRHADLSQRRSHTDVGRTPTIGDDQADR